MAKITKHSRKSGATTVRRDGKIVGNIGRGKTKTPISATNLMHRLKTTMDEENPTSTLSDAQQKFDNLSQNKISFEQAQTLWNLTLDKNLVERLNILNNYIYNILPSDREKMLGEIDEQVGAETMFIVLSGESPYGNLSSNILSAYSRYSRNDFIEGQKKAIAENKGTAPETLDFLSDSDDNFLVFRVTDNPNTAPTTLEKIFTKVEESELGVLCNIAKHKNTPFHILEKLAYKEESQIRQNIAMNCKTPIKILSLLSTDSHSFVKEGVAQNRNTPPEILDKLSRSFDIGVVWHVASNSNAPYATLKRLAEGLNEDVAYIAKNNPKYYQHAGKGGANL